MKKITTFLFFIFYTYAGLRVCLLKIKFVIHSFIHSFILFSIISKQFNTKNYKYWKDQENEEAAFNNFFWVN